MDATYLEDVDVLLAAGQRLRRSLEGEDEEFVVFSVQELEAAADRTGAGFRTLRFESDMEDRSPKETPQDALEAILFEVQGASLLIAAGESLPEIEPDQVIPGVTPNSVGGLTLLDEAIARLDNSRRRMGTGREGRVYFSGDSVKSEEPFWGASAADDVAVAIQRFRECADRTLEGLLVEANRVVTHMLDALAKLDPAKIRDALEKFAPQSEDLSALGRLVRRGAKLIRRGVEKLKEAFDWLSKLIGAELLQKIQEKVQAVWKSAQEGKYTRSALEWTFGIATTRAQIKTVLAAADLRPAALSEATTALASLSSRYEKQMALMEDLVSALVLATPFLAFIPGKGILFVAGGHLVLLGAVLLIGMDYTDSGRVLRWVRGVGEITQAVLS